MKAIFFVLQSTKQCLRALNPLNKGITLSCLVLAVFTTFFITDSVQATEANEISDIIEIKKIDNENSNPDLSYFELSVDPDDSQDLQVEITNVSKDTIVIQQKIFSAWTGDNAVRIEYSENNTAYDSSLKYEMDEYVTINGSDTLKLAPNETITVTAQMNIPADMPVGEALGGWTFTIDNSSSDNTTDKLAYLIGIQLFIDKQVETDEFKLNNISGSDDTLSVQIQNPIAKTMELEQITFSIYAFGEDDKERIVKRSYQDARFAPNSYSNFTVETDEEPLTDGLYTFEASFITTDGSEIILESDFKVNEQAIELVEKSTDNSTESASTENSDLESAETTVSSEKTEPTESSNTNSLLLIAAAVIIVLLAAVLVVVIKRKPNK